MTGKSKPNLQWHTWVRVPGRIRTRQNSGPLTEGIH